MAFDFEKESVRMALQSIRERKLRSVLTVTGIVIGIAAIVSMVSIGDGTNKYIQEQFEQLGANNIIISSISFQAAPLGGESLTESDLGLVKSVRGVEKAIPMLYTTTPVTYKDVTLTTMIIALNSDEAMDLFEGSQFDIESGRWIRSGDKYVVTLGKLAAEENFGREINVRDKVMIKDKEFEVIGVMKEIGNSQDDSQMYMTIEALRELVGTTDEIDAIYARALDTSNVEDVADRIQQKLDNKYGEDTFTVMSTSTLAGQVTSIMSAVSIALGGIAGIALLVAGIGISNTMYMTILERTKEIGIMKAIGAAGPDILKIFLTEAAIIGLIGGIVGVMLGTGISRVLGYVLESQGLPLKTVVTPDLALFAAGFSLVVGVVSGYLPSRQAAQLDPIQALRYE